MHSFGESTGNGSVLLAGELLLFFRFSAVRESLGEPLTLSLAESESSDSTPLETLSELMLDVSKLSSSAPSVSLPLEQV